jgi:hypothetical protein
MRPGYPLCWGLTTPPPVRARLRTQVIVDRPDGDRAVSLGIGVEDPQTSTANSADAVSQPQCRGSPLTVFPSEDPWEVAAAVRIRTGLSRIV